MRWVKRGSCGNVRETIEANSGLRAEELLNPPSVLPESIVDMANAANIIKKAIKNDERVHIVGDYDADGITSSAILCLTLRHLGCEPTIRLPRRFSEGYGLSKAIAEEIDDGVVITVDNGITAIEGIDALQLKGLTVIVMDHHLPGDKLPEADCIIDPHVYPETDRHSFRHYCGAGLALKFAELLVDNAELLNQLTVLAAIGTVADVVPLIGDNRRIVRDGLRLSGRFCVTDGLAALMEAVDVTELTEHEIAYKIAPLLNAPGRLYDDGANMGYNLLLSQDVEAASGMAEEIVSINEQRKALVKEAYERATKIIEDDCLYGLPFFCVYDPETSEGIVGIIAGKIAEAYKVPAAVFTDSKFEPGTIKGSGRSYGGVKLKETLEPLKPMFKSFGGHDGAVGLSFNKKDYHAIAESIAAIFDGIESAANADELEYDLEINENDIPIVLGELKKFAPYGEGNPMPTFLVKNIVLSPRYGSHFKVMGADLNTVKMYAKGFDVLSFGGARKYIESGNPRRIDVLGAIAENKFKNTKTLQIQADDFARTEDPEAKPESSLSAALGMITI
jgi:single-stranded-DNA-specific exonuclease